MRGTAVKNPDLDLNMLGNLRTGHSCSLIVHTLRLSGYIFLLFFAIISATGRITSVTPLPEATTIQAPVISTVPKTAASITVAGNWTKPANAGDRLYMFPNHTFGLQQALKTTGMQSGMRGKWVPANETVCRMEAMQPSPGGVGTGYNSATGILDPAAGTLRISAYKSAEECNTGLVMFREKP